MKRFHAHLSVSDIKKNVDFYSHLFGTQPIKLRDDYAKWQLDDPALNFSISSRGAEPGFNHFGIQVDSNESLLALREAAEKASQGSIFEEGETVCCYANSNKHWTLDPQGIAWEHFYTMSDAVTFSDLDQESRNEQDKACCTPLRKDAEGKGDCCVPNDQDAHENTCCGS